MANRFSILLRTHDSMKRQKDRTLKDELPRSVGAQYATGNQWRNNSRKNEGTEQKQNQHPVVDVSGGESRVRQNGHHLKVCKQKVLERMWRKGNTLALLVEIQIDTATMMNSMEISLKN